MAQINANGISLEYDEIGPRDGAPVLLISGYTAQMTDWTDVFRDGLVQAGLRVIRYDNRDAGLTQRWDGIVPDLKQVAAALREGRKPPVPYVLADLAADAAALLDALGVTSAHVMGRSMGGMIAQLVALEHPAKARSLVSLMSTTSDPSLPRSAPETQEALMKRPPTGDREAAIEHSLWVRSSYASTKFPMDREILRARVGANYDRAFYPEGAARQWAAIMAAGPRSERLKTLKVPALVLHGSVDRLIPPEAGRHTAACIPGAAYREIDGWGHDFPDSVVPVLLGHILPFVAKVEDMREDGFAIPVTPGCCGAGVN